MILKVEIQDDVVHLEFKNFIKYKTRVQIYPCTNNIAHDYN